jgi:hypothetical protein
MKIQLYHGTSKDIDNLVFMTDKAHRQFHLQLSKIKAGDKLI